MPRCSVCGNKIEVTFLNKLLGTIIKDKKGKQHMICFECQKKFHNKEILLSKLR